MKLEEPTLTPLQAERLRAAAAWTGWPLQPGQIDLLGRLGHWLAGEAIAAGALGPHEKRRIVERHLADGLLFAVGARPPHPPRHVVDLGSGVGLPGLPLAILWPSARVFLVDSSRRRLDLARRAIRILALDNVEALPGDAARPGEEPRGELVVARAAAPPGVVAGWASGWTAPGGVVVIGGSHRHRPRPGPGEQIVTVPEEILDRPVWLRMMAPA